MSHTRDGIPSPSPTFPQNVNVVTGENTINIVGKNLFDGEFRQGSESATTSTSYVFSKNDLLLPSGTYTFSNTLISDYDYAIFGTQNAFPTSETKIYNSGWKKGNTTFTISQDLHIGILIRKGGGDFTPSDISSYNFQIEKSSTASTYQPYQSNSYGVTLYKNLACYNDKSNVGNINVGNIKSGVSYTLYINTLGYISFNLKYGSSGSTIGSYYHQHGKKVYTFTASQDAVLYINTFISDVGAFIKFEEIMLLEGTYTLDTIGDYIPYFEPIELCDINGNKDYLYRENGTWYKYEVIGKIKLTGVENWQPITGVAYNSYALSGVISAKRTDDTAPYLCNYFKPITTNQRYIDGTIFINVISSIAISHDSSADVTAFKTWLTTHNTDVYYIRENPQAVQITNQYLINQLNALYEAESYYDTTNVMTEGQDLTPIVTIEALEKIL